MESRPFRQIIPGHLLSRSELARFGQQVGAASRLSGPRVAAGAGYQIKPRQPDWFWAILTARDDSGPQPVYSWTRLLHFKNADGGIDRVPDESFQGSPQYLPAFEAMEQSYPVPSIVKLRRGIGRSEEHTSELQSPDHL